MHAHLRLILAIVGVLVLVSSVAADEKAHRKASENLLLTMNVDKLLQGAIDQTLDVQIKANPAIAPYRDVMKKFFVKHMSWEKLKEDLITIYADAFTEEELIEITKFYKTPAGKKMVEKAPQLMAKGMQLGVERVQANQAELMKMLEEARDK